jgi:hypothetical protein
MKEVSECLLKRPSRVDENALHQQTAPSGGAQAANNSAVGPHDRQTDDAAERGRAACPG